VPSEVDHEQATSPDGTNQQRGKDWPRVGDDVIGGSELVIGADPLVGEGAFRIVRPVAN